MENISEAIFAAEGVLGEGAYSFNPCVGMVIVGMLFGGAVKCKYNSYMYYMCVSLYVLVLHVSTLRAQNNQSQIPLTCDLT